MKRWMKIIAGLFVIGIMAALYVWFFVYNKPHRDYEKAKPDHKLSAQEVFSQYRNDKALADSLYAGMVLQVHGRLAKVESRDSLVVAIFIFDQGMFGDEGVRCTMLSNQHSVLENFGKGDHIVIKGYCTGYNDTDVILEHSSVIADH